MKELQKKNIGARITFFKSFVACEKHFSVGAWSRMQHPRYTDWDCEGKRLDNVSIPLRNVPSNFELQLQLVGKLKSEFVARRETFNLGTLKRIPASPYLLQQVWFTSRTHAERRSSDFEGGGLRTTPPGRVTTG